MRRGNTLGALLGATSALVAITACSSPAPKPAASSSTAPLPVTAPVAGTTTAAQPEVVTRWWHNSAAAAGSTVDPAKPDAVAAKLSPSRTDYCAMLRETVAAGHSVLAGVAPTDPNFAAATTAFVSELERVAPREVASSWQVLGGLITSLVSGKSGSHPDASTIRSAVTTVSADAKTRCGISLSRAG